MKKRNVGRIEMKKVLVLVALFTLFLVAGASAETKTISWNPVTTYTDNTAVTGTALPVKYDAFWSALNTLANPHVLQTNGIPTFVVFDIVTQGMVRGTTIYFSARSRTATGEVSVNAPAFSWVVPNLALASLAISSGPSSVNEGSSATYGASATWSDSSTSVIASTWSVSPTTYASISSGGVLSTVGGITTDQQVTITASYTSGGVTKTATKVINIVNSATIVPPSGFSIQ